MGFERAFMTLFGQDVQSFTEIMILNLDQLRQQLVRKVTSNEGSSAALGVLSKQLNNFVDSKYTVVYDYDSQMTMKCFAEHTKIDVDQYRDMLRQYLDKVKEYVERQPILELGDDDKAESHDEQACDSLRLGLTVDAKLVNTELMNAENDERVTSAELVTQVMVNIPTPNSSNEVSSIDQYNTPSNVSHHTDQINPSYNTNLLRQVDSALLLTNSTNMCYKGGENDLYDVFKNDLFDENPCLKVEFSKTLDQTMVDKEAFNQLQKSFSQLQKTFSQLQKHCIDLELEIQCKEECFQNSKPCLNPELPDLKEYFLINNLKTQLHDKDSTINCLKNQIKMYEQRNDAKWEYNVYETNCKITKLRVDNENLKVKCNILHESLKHTNTENINQTVSHLANYDDFSTLSLTACTKTPSMHTVPSVVSKCQMRLNLSKPSILGKPVLKNVDYQTYIRQPNAFGQKKLSLSKPSILGKPGLENVCYQTTTRQPKIFSFETSKFSNKRCVSQVDKKPCLTNPVRPKPTSLILNGLKPVKPLRHRPRKYDHSTTHHKNVTMHETHHKFRSSGLWIPTGRTFVMNGHKWSCVCTTNTGDTKGLHNRSAITGVWHPKTLTYPPTSVMSAHT